MRTAAEILRDFGLPPPPKGNADRYYVPCPKCSATRSRAHQSAKCLGVSIDGKGVQFGCNHCGWTGGGYFNGQADHDLIVATYDYTDEAGALISQKVRTAAKKFWQRRPDGNGGWINNTKGTRRVLYRLAELIEALALDRPIFVVEGEKDADNLYKIGLAATCNPDGASEPNKKPKWRREFSERLHDADVIVIPDHDPAGYAHADAVASMSAGIARRVRLVKLAEHWPECPLGGDVSDWLAAEHTREELDALVERTPDYITESASKREPAPKQYPARTIEQTLEVFERWLILPDRTPVYAVLGAVAANLLPGDAVWLGLIGPPSSAKTEILNSISLLPSVVQAATLTPAGLLSGTPKRQHDKGAKGGLLRQIGEFEIVALKDFGSVLSMRADAKAEILAALREVYDGAWTRHLGTDGGKTLAWQGKVGLVFCATGVIDSHYSVIGAMGDRFLLSRLAPVERGQFGRALQHIGAATKQMRIELAEAVAGLFAARSSEPRAISDDEIERIDAIISLVVRLRGAVERDRHNHELLAVLGAEGTARIGLMLERLLAGMDTLGIDRAVALDIIESVALNSVPPLRRQAYEHLQRLAPNMAKTSAVAKALGLPTNTVRRALEELAAYGLVERTSEGEGKADLWRLNEGAP